MLLFMKSPITMEERRAENRANIATALEAVIAYARVHDEIIKVILFGSAARGSINALSDLDVLIIMNTDRDFYHRNQEIMGALGVPVDVDILCYRPDEIERNSSRPFFRHILTEGKVVYEKRTA